MSSVDSLHRMFKIWKWLDFSKRNCLKFSNASFGWSASPCPRGNGVFYKRGIFFKISLLAKRQPRSPVSMFTLKFWCAGQKAMFAFQTAALSNYPGYPRESGPCSFLIIHSVLYNSWDYYGKIYMPLITLVDRRLTQEAQQHPSNGFKRLFSVHTDHHACQRSVRVRRRRRCKQARCCGNERLRGELGNQNNAVWRYMIHFNTAVYSAILLNFQEASNVYNCYFEPFTRIKWHTIRFWPSLFFADGQLWERLGDRKGFGCWLRPDRPWYEIKLFRLHCLATCVSVFSILTPDHILSYNKPEISFWIFW